MEKSCENALFRPYLLGFWVNFIQTPKVGAPRASRTCFHTTRGPKTAYFGQISAIYGKIWTQTGQIWGYQGVKTDPKWSKSRSSQIHPGSLPDSQKLIFGLWGVKKAPERPLRASPWHRNMAKMRPKLGKIRAKYAVSTVSPPLLG